MLHMGIRITIKDSINTNIDNSYEQFLAVKRYFYKTSGNSLFHFVVVYNARSTWNDNIERAESLSRSIAAYFSDRYQVVCCIHKEPRSKKYGCYTFVYHVHFIMNSVSYIDAECFREIILRYMRF